MQPPYGPSGAHGGGFVPPPGYGPPGVMSPGAPNWARSQIGPPAIALMIGSGLTFFWYLAVVGMLLFAGGISMMDSGRPDALFGSAIGSVVYGFFALMGLITFFGALRMRALKNYGFAMASAIIAIIPCTSYMCCVLMMPFGIWSLVVLMKPEVKSAFT